MFRKEKLPTSSIITNELEGLYPAYEALLREKNNVLKNMLVLQKDLVHLTENRECDDAPEPETLSYDNEAFRKILDLHKNLERVENDIRDIHEKIDRLERRLSFDEELTKLLRKELNDSLISSSYHADKRNFCIQIPNTSEKAQALVSSLIGKHHILLVTEEKNKFGVTLTQVYIGFKSRNKLLDTLCDLRDKKTEMPSVEDTIRITP